jgi:hypothetical protein
MTTGLDKFKKKWGSSIERTKKEGRKAAEGHMLKQIADKKKAEESFHDKAEKYIKENNIPVPEDEQYTIITESFLNKMTKDIEEKAEMEMTKQIEQLIANMENRIVEKLMGEKIKLAEIELKKLELQVELARIESAKMMNEPVEFELTPFSMEGKVEEVEDTEGKLEEVEEPKKKRTGKVIIPPIKSPVPDEYTTTRGVNWKAIKSEGKFLDVMYQVVKHAAEHGINVANGKEFKEFSKITNGAYQQYMLENKGTKGAWKALMVEFGL